MKVTSVLRLRESFLPLFGVLAVILIVALVIDSRVADMASAYQVVQVGKAMDRWNEGQMDDDGMNGSEADLTVDLEAVSPILRKARELTRQGRYRDAIHEIRVGLASESENPVLLNELGVLQLRSGNLDGAEQTLNTAVKSDPDYFRAYYNRAIIRSRTGQTKAAISDYQQAISLRPRHFESNYNLGLLYLKRHDAKKAYTTLNRAVKYSSGDGRATALFSLGRAQAKLGNGKDAIRSYEKAIEYRPGYILPRYNLALLLMKNSDDTSKRQAARRIEEILALRPDFAPAYFVRARYAAATGHPDDAIRNYDTAISYDPMFWKARYNLALLYLEKNDLKTARSLFLEMKKDFPQKASVLFNLGRIAYGEKSYEEAEALYTEAIALEGGRYSEAELNLGVVKKARKQYEEADAIFENLIAHDANYSPAWLNKGLVLFRMKRYSDAGNAFESALQHGADPVKVHYNMGRLAFAQKQYDIARNHYEEALRADEHHLNSAVNLGVTLIKLKDLSGAATAYQRAVAMAPDQVEPKLKLAITLRRLKRWAKAAAIYRSVVEMDEENLSAWHNLGVCLARTGDSRGAADVFSQLLDRDAANVKARYNLALQLKKLNRLDEAQRELQAVLKLDESHFQSHVSLASILLARGDAAHALPHLQKARELHPADEDVHTLFTQYTQLAQVR